MKARNVLLIFIALVMVVFEILAVRYSVQQARLVRTLPRYERNPESHALLVEGTEYYIVKNGENNFLPIEVAKSPFGLESAFKGLRNKEFLFWVDEPGGAWIYMDARINVTRQLGFVYHRADTEVPALGGVTVREIRMSRETYPVPTHPRRWPAFLLSQDAGEISRLLALLEEGKAVAHPYRPQLLGTLQLRCAEYPGMAFVFQIRKGRDGRIYLSDMEDAVFLMDEHFSAMIEKGKPAA